MKKLLVVAAAVLLLFCACSGKAEQAGGPEVVIQNGVTYTLERQNGERDQTGTLSDGTYTYTYALSPRSGGYRLEITYPDGSSSWWETTGNGGYGGWSDNYTEGKYADHWTLRDVILEGGPAYAEGPGNLWLVVLLAALGGFNLLLPRASWYLSYGWRYKNAEPSDLVLAINRIGGGAVLAVALLLLLL